MKDRILDAIATQYGYSVETAETVFNRVKSFDTTIKVLRHSRKKGQSPVKVLNALMKVKDSEKGKLGLQMQ